MKNIKTRQMRAARALLGWSQEDLSAKSGVSISTVRRLEASDGDLGGKSETVEKMVGALVDAGITFLPNSDLSEDGIGVFAAHNRTNAPR